MEESDRKRILQSQLAMTPETWAQMRAHGVSEETPLDVEIFFYTPSEGLADSLARDLVEQWHYRATVGTHEDTHSVRATIPSRSFDEESLLQLTRDMCELGARHDAEFDGWGAPIPSTAAPRKPWWRIW